MSLLRLLLDWGRKFATRPSKRESKSKIDIIKIGQKESCWTVEIMVTQELIPRKEKLFVSCWLLWSIKNVAKVGPLNIYHPTTKLHINCSPLLVTKNLDGDILATKSGTGDGLVSRRPNSWKLLIFSKKGIFVSWNSGYLDFWIRWPYLGNKKSYWRSAGGKITSFIRAFQILQNN